MSRSPSIASELLWEARQNADRAAARVESRAAWKRQAAALCLIALTLAVATIFARV